MPVEGKLRNDSLPVFSQVFETGTMQICSPTLAHLAWGPRDGRAEADL